MLIQFQKSIRSFKKPLCMVTQLNLHILCFQDTLRNSKWIFPRLINMIMMPKLCISLRTLWITQIYNSDNITSQKYQVIIIIRVWIRVFQPIMLLKEYFLRKILINHKNSSIWSKMLINQMLKSNRQLGAKAWWKLEQSEQQNSKTLKEWQKI